MKSGLKKSLIGLSLGILLTTGSALAAADERLRMAMAEALSHAPALPREAILRYAATDLEQWHYQRTRRSEEGVVVDRHDPTLPGEAHWQLISIDGREPTDRERRDYEKDRADHSERDERARGEELVQVLRPGSIAYVGDEGDAQRFSYGLQSPDGKRKRVFEALEGELLIESDVDSPWVREVRVWNSETLRPYLGVRIDEAQLSFTFERQGDWILPQTVEARWTGEFLLLRDIGNELFFKLEDFRHVNETSPSHDALAP